MTTTSSKPTTDEKFDWDEVLKVENFSVHYATPKGDVIAVNDVNFSLRRGELLGLIGESGCGKTTTAMAILRLVQPPGRIVNGKVTIDGVDVTSLQGEELRKARWSKMALVPQGAMNSLNPLMRIKDQIADVIETHEGKQDKKALKERILQLFTNVGAAQPDLRYVSARAQRWDEAARLYRPGYRAQSAADHRRRADKRARRHRAAYCGADAARYSGEDGCIDDRDWA